MYFLLYARVRNFDLPWFTAMTFTVNRPRPIRIELHSRSYEDGFKDFEIESIGTAAGVISRAVYQVQCLAQYERDPNPRVRAMMNQLLSGELPKGSSEPPGGWNFYLEYAKAHGEFMPPLNYMPNSMKDFVTSVYRELSAAVTQAVSLVSWRFAIEAPHRPVNSPFLSWSEDGQNWHSLPSLATSAISNSKPRPASEMQQTVQVYLDQETEAPLAHSIFREAWHQRYSNPRSAIVTGIAAAEVGCKQCITELAPETQWLIQNMPSPSLESLVWGQLRLLQPAFRVQIPKVLPPVDIRQQPNEPHGQLHKALSIGVLLRNRLVHTDSATPDDKRVEDVLLAVSDLLWIFDYYLGNDWALSHVRPEILAEWMVED